MHTDAFPPNCAKKRKSAYPSTGEKKKEEKTFEKPLQHIFKTEEKRHVCPCLPV